MYHICRLLINWINVNFGLAKVRSMWMIKRNKQNKTKIWKKYILEHLYLNIQFYECEITLHINTTLFFVFPILSNSYSRMNKKFIFQSLNLFCLLFSFLDSASMNDVNLLLYLSLCVTTRLKLYDYYWYNIFFIWQNLKLSFFLFLNKRIFSPS